MLCTASSHYWSDCHDILSIGWSDIALSTISVHYVIAQEDNIADGPINFLLVALKNTKRLTFTVKHSHRHKSCGCPLKREWKYIVAKNGRALALPIYSALAGLQCWHLPCWALCSGMIMAHNPGLPRREDVVREECRIPPKCGAQMLDL